MLKIKPPAALVRAFEAAEHNAARALIKVADRIHALVPDKLGHMVDGNRLDSGIYTLLRMQDIVTPFAVERVQVAASREQMRRDARVHNGPKVVVGSVRDLTLDTAVPLKARHYAPRDVEGPAPLIVFFHGGGFVVGDLDTHDLPCRLLCKQAGVHVLSVDYRLAPEHSFPAAVDDAIAAYDWAVAHAASLGADPRRIGVAGDSAGGNLSTVVAQQAVLHKKQKPVLQLLLYPSVDRTVDRPSLELFKTGYFLTRANIDWFTAQYLPNKQDLLDPRATPMLAKDLKNQSPAIVVTAGFDPLRDEDNAYAEKLRAAGNRVEQICQRDLVHGYINLGALSGIADARFQEVTSKVKEVLAREQLREMHGQSARA